MVRKDRHAKHGHKNGDNADTRRVILLVLVCLPFLTKKYIWELYFLQRVHEYVQISVVAESGPMRNKITVSAPCFACTLLHFIGEDGILCTCPVWAKQVIKKKKKLRGLIGLSRSSRCPAAF